MPHTPRKKLKTEFDQALAGNAYFSIFSIEAAPAKDAPGKWDVLFYVSGSKDDVTAPSPLKESDIRRLMHLYYAFAADRPGYEGEESRNLHVARVDSKARAERLASELTYILQDAGIEPMRAEKGKYAPMAPETSRPKFFPPRGPKT